MLVAAFGRTRDRPSGRSRMTAMLSFSKVTVLSRRSTSSNMAACPPSGQTRECAPGSRQGPRKRLPAGEWVTPSTGFAVAPTPGNMRLARHSIVIGSAPLGAAIVVADMLSFTGGLGGGATRQSGYEALAAYGVPHALADHEEADGRAICLRGAGPGACVGRLRGLKE
jgi:hypothetical protein